MDPIIQGLGQFGLAGALCAAFIWIMYYLLSTLFPKMLETFREENAKEREECNKKHAENMAQHRKTQEDMEEGFQGLRHGMKNLENTNKVWWEVQQARAAQEKADRDRGRQS